MREEVLAQEYAEALYDSASGEHANVLSFFEYLTQVYSHSALFRDFISHPALSKIDKIEMVLSLSDKPVSPAVRFIVSDLVGRRRMELIGIVTGMLESIHQEKNRIETAVVTSAAPLNEVQKSLMTEALKKYSGMSIAAEFKVDAALLGGLTVRIGEIVLDNSVRNDLDNIAAHLSAACV
jgi:F-type H+-transporting ATPase subunit delta